MQKGHYTCTLGVNKKEKQVLPHNQDKYDLVNPHLLYTCNTNPTLSVVRIFPFVAVQAKNSSQGLWLAKLISKESSYTPFSKKLVLCTILLLERISVSLECDNYPLLFLFFFKFQRMQKGYFSSSSSSS